MSEPTVTRAPEPEPAPGATVAAGTHTQPDATPVAPPGYELHTLIGSGGMGAVYRAHDLALIRDVAVKFLHARYAPESVAAWRFTEEARITAQLQHPGIPPVHQVGRTPDGRAFLAMKLIKGETLDSLLKARRTRADERGRFVGIFEQVAQAVAFAHSRRIIHRDLKPANVMVGDFGEVQVMDWGLAKELSNTPAPEAERTDATLSLELRTGRDGAGATQAGSLLGTPAFMPPEQAVGAIDQIDERADVFGLGAILCVILTGEPPYVADTAEAARVLAARGKLDECFARLDTCGAEPELVALAKKCLSPEALDRPAGAGEVARAVAAFRADAERRARQAETDRATAEVKAAEERKRRRVQRILALTLFGLLAVAVGALWWIDAEQSKRRADQQADELRREAERKDRAAELRSRQLITERDVTAALNEVRVLREQGLKQADDPDRWKLTLGAARSAFLRAHGLLAAGAPTDELLARLAAAAADLDRDERDRTLLAELDRIADESEIRLFIPIEFSGVGSRRYAAAFRAHGIDFAQQDTTDIIARLKAHRFRDRLALALRNWSYALAPTEQYLPIFIDARVFDPWSAIGGGAVAAALQPRQTRGAQLREILKEATEDPFAREWWEAFEKGDEEVIKKLLVRPELRQRSARELAALAEGLLRFKPELMPQMLALAYERFPGEFWVHMRLAYFTDLPDEADHKAKSAAVRHLTAAVAARPRSVIALSALGTMLDEQSDPTGPLLVKRAIEIDPTSPWPHLFVAMSALEKKQQEQTLAAFKGAIRADPDVGYFFLHTIYFTAAAFGESGPDIGPLDPFQARLIAETAPIHPNHCGSQDLLGQMYIQAGNYPAALAAFRRADACATTDYPRRPLLRIQLQELELFAQWADKIGAVRTGAIVPRVGEWYQVVSYCALFEKRYARAAELAERALGADAENLRIWTRFTQFAGYAVQAAAGNGADADTVTAAAGTELRKKALAWLREGIKQTNPNLASYVKSHVIRHADLYPVRDPQERAKLPPDERAEWDAFWAEVGPAHEIAPPPREVKP